MVIVHKYTGQICVMDACPTESDIYWIEGSQIQETAKIQLSEYYFRKLCPGCLFFLSKIICKVFKSKNSQVGYSGSQFVALCM